jgi:hypothetical protein
MKENWTLKENNYLKITGTFNNAFRPQKALKKTRIKLYNSLAFSVLLYGSETWTIKARDASRITAEEMKYMRRTAGYIWTDLKNKYTNCKGVKNNSNFGQITRILGQLDTRFKQIIS